MPPTSATSVHRTSTTTASALPRLRARHAWATLRILMGWTFLWAFLDKTFGFGFATVRENAWQNGGSPTHGFLTFGTSGPLASFYQSIAGHPVVDALFMLGLLGVGLALTLGIGMRVATVSGALMLLLMYTAALPPANNPVVDDHIVMAVLLGALVLARAGDTWGFGARWKRLPVVRDHSVLE